MSLEVEQKFRVADLAALEQRLAAQAIRFSPPVVQIDHYFNHPARNFAETDEAVRIRSVGDDNRITYKGPKVSKQTKTRHEIELPLATGAEAQESWTELLGILSFSPVAVVRKQRRLAQFAWNSYEVEIALDEVDRLGSFAELEIVVSNGDFAEAEQALLELATELGLTEVERHGYLDLLLKL